MTKFKKIKGTGVVIGKFYPFHLGHAYLIKTALKNVKDLTVIVCDRKGQTISGQLRAKWILENHPGVNIKVIEDVYDDDDSKTWAEKTLEWLNFIPEFVFTSEDYGDLYAHFLGSTHVLVDKNRVNFPISGRKIRRDPLNFLNYLAPNVRFYYESNLRIRG